MPTSSPFSEAFLADLDLVCPSADNGNLSRAFMNDLEVAFAHAQSSMPAVPDVSASDLAELAEVHLHWRTLHQATLEQHLHRLPPDDPLLSPVSLFGTMDYGRLETAHTRALAWLLGDREHGFGFRLLEALLQHLRSDVRTHVTRGQVASEVAVDCGSERTNGGRIDIFAEGAWEESGRKTTFRMVIEAKIDADESNEQLSSYERWLDRSGDQTETFRLFLTPTGRGSRTGKGSWSTLSFLDLAGVLRRVGGLNEKPGYHFLRYYLTGVLRDVCGLPIPISKDCSNPYAAVDYLKSVLERSETEVGDGPTR